MVKNKLRNITWIISGILILLSLVYATTTISENYVTTPTINSTDWTNVTITESQISDYTNHTNETFNAYNSTWSLTYNDTYNTWAYNQTTGAQFYTNSTNNSLAIWVTDYVNDTNYTLATWTGSVNDSLAIWVTSGLDAQDECSEITGCIQGAYNSEGNLTGILNSSYAPNTTLGIHNLINKSNILFSRINATDWTNITITELRINPYNLNSTLGIQKQINNTSNNFTNLEISSLTNGSVLFAGTGGLVSQDNSNFFWDDINNRLGVGGVVGLGTRLTIAESTDATKTAVSIINPDITTGNQNTINLQIGQGNTAGASGFLGYRSSASGSAGVGLTTYGRNLNDLFVNNLGNVGIGTYNATTKLEVNGGDLTIVGGNLKFDNNRFFYQKLTGGSSVPVLGISVDDKTYLLSGSGGDIVLKPENSITAVTIKATTGNVGIATTTPDLAILQVNGSVGGITAYFENNISAEDYLTHSVFPSEDYSDEQALMDLIKVSGDGKLNHSSLPNNSFSVIEKPIYEETIIQKEIIETIPIYENYTYIEEVCEYEKEVFGNSYNLVCYNETEQRIRIKQICHTEIEYIYEEINSTEKYNKIPYEVEVCENVYQNVTNYEEVVNRTKIGIEEEPHMSVGMMMGNIVKSIKQLFNWNTEQDSRIRMLEEELCKKDSSYIWCK